MPASNTYEPISSVILSNASSSVTFGSIPQTYTDLVLIMSAAASTGAVGYRVGNTSIDSSSNYSRTNLYGDGTTAASSRQSSQTALYVSTGTASPSFSANVIHFMNYSNTTTNKSFISRSNVAASVTVLSAGLWRSTSAISIIEIFGDSANLVSGSTFSLYGIKAA